ncbi:MAG: S-methyl-5-thioribose-1-phosphate isomerase [Ruminococcaceae bacterium]|nr:S-methyl-5-thioribose-1-phosphate isomerase [Oscillospiraceae bacterium]
MEYLSSDSVRLSEDEKSVVIIDQTKLPNETEYLTLSEADELYDAIKLLKVRGAPAIGIFAGYSMYVLSLGIDTDDRSVFLNKLKEYAAFLDGSRPTAVNLSAATKRIVKAAEEEKNLSVKEMREKIKRTAVAIHEEDIEMCRKISEYGLTLVKDGFNILTHCNAGPLATSRYGTGLGTLMLGKEKGYTFHAFCDETRPLLQGARLTAYELLKAGIDVTLICDNMAGFLMKQGKIDAVFVGCDRVASNGDTANKIGTSSLSVLAHYYDVPFYVFCPSSTIDFSAKSGEDITIEYREPDEIRSMFYKEPVAPDVKCLNPAFDVTDGKLITAIVTEKGICRYPYEKSLAELFLS